MTDNPDNPMARPLSRAEEERLYGDDVADAQRADFAIERTLDVIKNGFDAAFDELEIGEYDKEAALIVQALKLAATGRDDAVIAAAVQQLLHQVISNRDPKFWDEVDERARRISQSWREVNNVARMAAGLSIRSKA